jgi:S1-C subfamily serine protease
MRLRTTAVLLLGLALPAAALAQDKAEVKSDNAAATLEVLYQKAIEKAAPAVVAIKVEREAEPEKPAPAAPSRPSPLGPFRGLPDVFAKRPADAWCSGTVVEPDGLIVTTCFNCTGKVKSIKVLLPDGRELPGKLLGSDASCDLAAIKVEADGLPTLPRARLEELRAGNPLLALGRAPDGKGITANPGIVSASSRLAGRGIQTDAKLNFGNVGGPVVDLEGRLVGISCKVDVKPGISSTRGQNSGVGFAITHDRLYGDILKELKAGRMIAEPRKPFLGIEYNQKSTVTDGVELASVQAGGAAERAGLKAGDIILAFDGRRTEYFEQLREAILSKSPGDKVKVKVRRKDQEIEFDCELGWAPGE